MISVDFTKLKASLARQKEQSGVAVRAVVEKVASDIKNSGADEALQSVVATAREVFRQGHR